MRGINIEHRPGRGKPYILRIELDGERRQTGYATEREAKAEAARVEREVMRNGKRATEWDAKAHAEWTEARKIIDDEAVSLSAVAAFWKQHSKRACPVVLVEDAVEAFLKDNTREGSGLSKMHTADLRRRCRRFARDLKGRAVASISSEDCRAWLLRLGVGPRGVRNSWQCASNFLHWSARRGWTDSAPDVHESDMPKLKATKKGVLSQEQAGKLFAYLRDNRPHFLAWFALQAFAGVRREEAGRMRWDFVRFDERRIVVPAEVCKTGDDWVMDELPDNLWLWLALVRDMPLKAPANKSRDLIIKAVGLDWPSNALRHSFCTYHLSLNRSAERTALLLRHRNASQLWRSYFAGLKPRADAEAYFKIAPELK